MLVTALLLVLTSCGKTVPQAEYDKVSNELSMATRTINQQTAQLSEIIKKNSDAEVYAGFLDLLMYPSFVAEGLPVRFPFKDPAEWQDAVNSTVEAMKDDKLKDYISKYQKGEIKVFVIIDYLINKIRQNTVINQ